MASSSCWIRCPRFLVRGDWEILGGAVSCAGRTGQIGEERNNTVGVIEKLENGKYYFAGYQYRIKILSIKENELRIEDFPYDLTYERK